MNTKLVRFFDKNFSGVHLKLDHKTSKNDPIRSLRQSMAQKIKKAKNSNKNIKKTKNISAYAQYKQTKFKTQNRQIFA